MRGFVVALWIVAMVIALGQELRSGDEGKASNAFVAAAEPLTGLPSKPDLIWAPSGWQADDAAVGSASTPEPTEGEAADTPLRTFVARTTAYSWESCSSPRCLTRSGTPVRWGVVAVDPTVIPLGSRLRIEGFGEQVFDAEDTGGGVRGEWVDIFMWSTAEALQHGVKYLTVEVLSDGPK